MQDAPGRAACVTANCRPATRSAELIAVDQALTRLEKIASQQARIVELRYFIGLNIEETADVLSISPATVKREWTLAKAFLRREVGLENPPA